MGEQRSETPNAYLKDVAKVVRGGRWDFVLFVNVLLVFAIYPRVFFVAFATIAAAFSTPVSPVLTMRW